MEEKTLANLTNLPLSPNQQRLWFTIQQNVTNPAYNLAITYRFDKEVDYNILKKSLTILFNRHYSVFSVFRQKEGKPYIDIIPGEIKLNYQDFSNSPDSKKEAETFMSKDTRSHFDLETGPLFRIFLIKESNQSFYLHSTFHHLIFDGWSIKVYLNELNKIYNNVAKNIEENYKHIHQSFDFANLEEISADDEKYSELVTFWKDYLKDCNPEIRFTQDYPRKKASSGNGEKESICIPEFTTNRLKEIAKETNSTLFKVTLTALGIFLQKYTGDNDINIGIPIAKRRNLDLLEILGFFVGSAVVRLNKEPNCSFYEYLKYSNESINNAVKNSKLTFDQIVKAVNPKRSLINPLYNVTFSWIDKIFIPLDFNGSIGKKAMLPEDKSIDDITFYLWEDNNCIVGDIEYNTDIFKRETIARLINNFVSFVETLVKNLSQRVDFLPIITQSDKEFILKFNNTDAPYESEKCIHQKFEEQVRKNPDSFALVSDTQTLTYKELNDHTNRMANFLISKGVRVEDKVAVCLDRSIEMMVSIIGILKAGGAYVPLNPENPSERLQSIIEEANPKLILSSTTASSNLPKESPIIYVDNILLHPLCEDSSTPNTQVNSNNLAYVLYTSGSTGKPKGVMIEHHSVLNRLGWMQKAYPIEGNDTLIQKTPITFDVSVWELFWWFFNGAQLFLLKKGSEKDPEELISAIEKNKVTTIHFVPSMFASFWDTVETKKLYNGLTSLTRIFLSGEALPLKIVQEFNTMRSAYSLPDLINLYGPTEATVDVSYYNCPREKVENIYIGKPIDNTKLFVVNNQNMLQPIGVPGELLITGVNLARGYLNRPDLTNDRFFNFRLSENEILRAYHTGDLVIMTSKGEIDYIGRLDNQVKIRGFRIELGDIEAKIFEHHSIKNCAVIVEEKGNNKFLVAYVSLKPDENVTPENLKLFLSGKLPDYMVPSFVVFMPDLPLTSSGKINRKALPKVDETVENIAISAPVSNSEIVLMNIWKELLQRTHINITDNFFDIGGNSILAITLANQISKEFNTSLKPLFIFEFPSIKDQSNFLSNNQSNASTDKIDEKNLKRKSINFRKLRD